jgi:ADP-ribosylglycohydrolase
MSRPGTERGEGHEIASAVGASLQPAANSRRDQRVMIVTDMPERLEQAPSTQGSAHSTVNSALWAAWGDALGFPAELVSQEMYERRMRGRPPIPLPPWERRIGGRMGPTVELPAGCPSDDTQLRLAVGRCVRASGRFDAEAFSKIELPVFSAYEFGSGRGTKAAARALRRRSTRWFANFFDTDGARYIDCGGNGAAMRVQPHVWAAADGPPTDYLGPVLRDAVCTHGHPRGLLGAAMHAVTLGTTIRQREIPGPDRWLPMVRFLGRVTDIAAEDETLASRWLPVWESNAGRPFPAAVAESISMLEGHVAQAAGAAHAASSHDAHSVYRQLARELGAFAPRSRGAGDVTAMLALWIAWVYREDPVAGLLLCARAVGSDTDTLATLAGALLGAVAGAEPPEPLLDAELIRREAERLHALSQGARLASFPHPDPLHWQPPANLSDAVGLIDGDPAIAGLGPAKALAAPIEGTGKEPALWQWLETAYGQRLLVKRRAELVELPESARPRARGVSAPAPVVQDQPQLFAASSKTARLPEDPERGVQLLAAQGFEPSLMASLLEHYALRGATPAAVFATLVSTELRRRPHTSSSNGASPGPTVTARRADARARRPTT